MKYFDTVITQSINSENAYHGSITKLIAIHGLIGGRTTTFPELIRLFQKYVQFRPSDAYTCIRKLVKQTTIGSDNGFSAVRGFVPEPIILFRSCWVQFRISSRPPQLIFTQTAARAISAGILQPQDQNASASVHRVTMGTTPLIPARDQLCTDWYDGLLTYNE